MGKENNTNLITASYEGNYVLVENLLNQGVDPNISDGYKGTALHQAVLKEDLNMVKLLIGLGADVNSTNQFKCTPLHFSITASITEPALEIIKNLLEHKADTNAADSFGLTPLHYAAGQGNVQVLQLLNEYGGNINATNTDGSSVMHSAAMGIKDGKAYCWEAIEWLVKHKADIYVVRDDEVSVRNILERCEGDYVKQYDQLLEELGYGISGDI